MTYLALKTMMVQNNIKHIDTIGLASKWQADIAGVFRSAWQIKVSWQNDARNIMQLVRC